MNRANKRTLRAILMGDVRGFSRLMGLDEDDTLERLSSYQHMAKEVIDRYGGQLIDTAGDSLLAQFGSVIDAVDAGIQLQREVERRNSEVVVERRMELRIGVNLGDVIEKDGKIYGDDVNIAARLEALAEPGGICISGSVYDNLRNKVRLQYDYLGEKELKNIASPVRVYGLSLRSESKPPEPAQPSAVGRQPEARSVIQSPFIGRETELSELLDIFQAALEGQGSVVFITGPAGIGKTRIARELRDRARKNGAVCLEGQYDKAVGHAYQPWLEMITRYELSPDHIPFNDLVGPYRQQLAKLVPELTEPVEGSTAAEEADPEGERLRLFEGLARFFIGISNQKPLVLLVDDLQWASSIDVLHHIARKIGNQRILILATYRNDELAQNPGLRATVLGMNRERLFYSLQLKSLSREHVEKLILGTAAPGLLDTIFKRTEGNPFFVEELMRFLRDRDALIQSPKGLALKEETAERIPESVRMVVEQRLDVLGEDVKEVLRIASVMGRDFSLPLLKTVADTSEDAIDSAIDLCEDASLVSPKEMAYAEDYCFVHDLVQEALYESLGPARRRRLHRKVGLALEQLHGPGLDECYDALAHHFLCGNNSAKAVEYSLKAAEVARQSSSWQRATSHLETVLRLIEKVPNDPRREAQVLESLAYVKGLLANWNVDYARRALGIYIKLGDKEKAAQMHQMTATAWASGTAGDIDFEKAKEHRQAAVELLKDEGEALRKAQALAYSALGFSLGGMLDMKAAMRYADVAMAIGEALQEPKVLARVYIDRSVVLAYSGDLATAEHFAERSWQCVANSETWEKIRSSTYPILFWPWRNERNWVAEWIEKNKTTKESVGTRFRAAVCGQEGILRAMSGQPKEAEEALQSAEQAFADHSFFSPYLMRYVGAAYAILGHWQKAAQHLEAALEAARKGNSASHIVDGCFYYGRFLLAKGEYDEAEKKLTEGYDIAHNKECLPQQLNLLPLLAELFLRTGRIDSARDYVARATGLFEKSQPWRGLGAAVHRVQGVVATHAFDWDTAEHAFEKAKATEQLHGFPYGEAAVDFALSEMFTKRNKPGDRQIAMKFLGSALEVFRRCSATKEVEKVEAALENLADSPIE